MNIGRRGSRHLQGVGVAAAAGITVEEVAGAPDAADAAGLAVELLLLQVIVEEAALEAGVCAKVAAAPRTHRRHRLPQIAQRAH